MIADLDMIVDHDKMVRVLSALMDDGAKLATVTSGCKEIADEIRGLPPEISPPDVARALTSIGSTPMDWSNGDDIEVRRQLVALANSIDRMRRLKKGGVAAFPGVLGSRLAAILEQLRDVGLFLVPVGELEGWLAGHGVSESKSNKSAWANAAAQKIQELGEQKGDVWEFVAAAGEYLSARSH